MKIFVCEYISGGGLYREPLPPSLAREGMLMRDALLRDLAQLPEVEVITSYDARLPPPVADQTIVVTVDDEVWEIWGRCIGEADAVWPIAPETGGLLLRLTALVEAQHKILLSCNSENVALTTSKYATFLALQKAGVKAVTTYLPENWPADQGGQWVAKPDDGVGCEGNLCFATSQVLTDWLAQGHGASYIIQPFTPGIAASICMLCRQGQAWLLSCNRQHVSLSSSGFVYRGSIVNGMAQHWAAFDALAQHIAKAIPGLSGYVGIDVLVDEDQVLVLEINPRLTTSYGGLHQAMGCNPARLVLDLLYNHSSSFAGFNMPEHFLRNVVDITLDEN